MTMPSRALIALGMNLVLVGSIGVQPALSESSEKDMIPEKSVPRPPHPPAVPESQSTPHKPSTETKPQPPAKAESSTDHKEVVPEKDATQEKSAPRPSGAESQSAPHKPSTEAKPQSPPAKVESATDHKENVPEKSAPRPPQPTISPESSATPHKPSTEAKPSKPSADTKAQTQTAPAIKEPEKDTKEKDQNESKEKEPVVKKTLGSLILSVKLALMGDSRLFRYEIEVEEDQQLITLTGRVSSDEEKAAATEVAQTVQGVKSVVNKLVLEKDLAKVLLKKQDEILTSLIKERFAKSATLKAANFEVKTEDGVVQLHGTVRFQVITLEAAETARQVPGVRAVNTEKVRMEGES